MRYVFFSLFCVCMCLSFLFSFSQNLLFFLPSLLRYGLKIRNDAREERDEVGRLLNVATRMENKQDRMSKALEDRVEEAKSVKEFVEKSSEAMETKTSEQCLKMETSKKDVAQSLSHLKNHLETNIFQNEINENLVHNILNVKSKEMCETLKSETKNQIENLSKVCENTKQAFQDFNNVISNETSQCVDCVKRTVEKFELLEDETKTRRIPKSLHDLTSTHKDEVSTSFKTRIEQDSNDFEKFLETSKKLTNSEFEFENTSKEEMVRVRDVLMKDLNENSHRTLEECNGFMDTLRSHNSTITSVTQNSITFLNKELENQNEVAKKRWCESVTTTKQDMAIESEAQSKHLENFEEHVAKIVMDVQTHHDTSSTSRKEFWSKAISKESKSLDDLKTHLEAHTKSFDETMNSFVEKQVEREKTFERNLESKLAAQIDLVNTQNTNTRNVLLAMKAQIDALLTAHDTFVKECTENRDEILSERKSCVTDLASRRTNFVSSLKNSESTLVEEITKRADTRFEDLKQDSSTFFFIFFVPLHLFFLHESSNSTQLHVFITRRSHKTRR